jgi:hypothetical protein
MASYKKESSFLLFEYQLMVLPIEVGPKMAGLERQLAA